MSLLAIVLIVPVCFAIFRGSKVFKKSALLVQSLAVGFGLYVIASIVSFFVYTDSLNILVFLVLYTAAFILSSLVNVGIIFIRKRKV